MHHSKSFYASCRPNSQTTTMAPFLARNLDRGRSNWPTLVEPQAYAKCTLCFVTNPSFFGDPYRVLPPFRGTFSRDPEWQKLEWRNVRMKKFLLFQYFFCAVFSFSLSCTYKMPKEETQSAKTLFLYSRIYQTLSRPGPARPPDVLPLPASFDPTRKKDSQTTANVSHIHFGPELKSQART